MKKVLIVEDTQENLESAKAFFSTIPGFEFVYATNRKEAESLLPAVDAMITDRSMPFDGIPQYSELDAQANGYLLAVNAKTMKKQVVMVSAHGNRAGITAVNISSVGFNKIAELVNAYAGREISEIEAGNVGRAKFGSGVFEFEWVDNLSKTSSECWSLAWGQLQKQF